MRRAKEIIPGKLYMASHPTKWPKGKIEWMEENVDLVVVLAARDDPELHNRSFIYWHCPCVDSHKTIDDAIPLRVVPTVSDWIRAGKRVLVCCLAGRSRSGATAALVVRDIYEVDGSTALDMVREKRPNAVKREGPEAWLRSLPAPEVPE